MKKQFINTVGLLLILLMIGATQLLAQNDAMEYYTVTGVVKNKDNKKKLENVNVSIPGTNLGTVTNADGVFSLKIKKGLEVQELAVSHIGFMNARVSLRGLSSDTSDLIVWMAPYTNLLNEIIVYGNTPRTLVTEALKKVPDNYPANPNMLTSFYRETVQKGKRYISVSEAVIDVYKTAYKERSADNDRVKIEKGRRLLSQKLSDTLAVKVVGGPNLSIYLDFVKNGDALISAENLDNYEYTMEDPVSIDNRMQYVVSFRPRVTLLYALFYGKLYIDRETLSFTRAEYSLDIANKEKAIQAILRKKPLGLRFKPQEISYLVSYKNQDDKTHLNYIRSTIRFKCDWKKRLFSSGYTVFSEMVVTDRKVNNLASIPYKNAFKEKEVFYDIVNEYWNEDFWKAYNIIEPTESLEHAVIKLKKQSN